MMHSLLLSPMGAHDLISTLSGCSCKFSQAYSIADLCIGCTDVLASPRKSVPHGYIAQSASDLMLFTNPLIQDTLPPDWENRQAT